MDDPALSLTPVQLESALLRDRADVLSVADNDLRQGHNLTSKETSDMLRNLTGLDPGRSKASVGDIQKVSSIDATPARLRPDTQGSRGSSNHARAASTVLSQPDSLLGSPLASKMVSDLAIMSPTGRDGTIDGVFSLAPAETSHSPASPSLSEALDDVLSPDILNTSHTANENLSPILPRGRSSYFRPGLHGGTPHSVSAMNSPVQAVSPGHISAHEYFQRSLLSNLSVVYGQRPSTSYLPSNNRSPSPVRAASVEVLSAPRDLVDSEDELEDQTHISSVRGSHRSLLIETSIERVAVETEKSTEEPEPHTIDYSRALSTSSNESLEELDDLDDLPLLDDDDDNALLESQDEPHLQAPEDIFPMPTSRPTTNGATTTTSTTTISHNIDVPNMSYEQSFFIPHYAHQPEEDSVQSEPVITNILNPTITNLLPSSEIFSSPLMQHDIRKNYKATHFVHTDSRPRSEPLPNAVPNRMHNLHKSALTSPHPSEVSQKAWETPATTKQYVAAFPTRTAVSKRVENFEIPQERLAALQPEIDAIQKKAQQPSDKLSLKESSLQIDTLQKENWGLKLKIMFLEKHYDHDQDKAALISDNVRLQEMAYNIGQQVKSRDRTIRSLTQQIADAEFDKVVTPEIDYEELQDKIAHLELSLENVKLDAEDREEYLHEILEQTKLKLQNAEDELYRVQTDYRVATASQQSDFSSTDAGQNQTNELRMVCECMTSTDYQELRASRQETKAVRSRLSKLSEFLHDSERELAQANESRENAIKKLQNSYEDQIKALRQEIALLSNPNGSPSTKDNTAATETLDTHQHDVDLIASLQARIDAQTVEIEDLTQAVKQIETRYDMEKSSHRTQIDDYAQRLAEADSQVADLREQYSDREHQHQEASDRISSLEVDLAELEAEKSRLLADQEDFQKVEEELKADNDRLLQELDRALTTVRDTRAQPGDASGLTSDDLVKVLVEFGEMSDSDPAVALRNCLFRSKDDIADMREQVKRSQNEAERIALAYKQKESELDSLQSELQHINRDLKQVGSAKSTLSKSLSQEIDRRGQVETVLQETSSKLLNVSEALAAMKEQYANIMTTVLPTLNNLLDNERRIQSLPVVYEANTYNRLLHSILEGLQAQADRAKQDNKQAQASSRKRTRDLEVQVAARDEKNDRLDRQLKEALKSLESLCKQNEKLQSAKKQVNGHKISASNVVDPPSRQVSVIKPEETDKTTDTWILYARIKSLNEALAYEKELRANDDVAAKARLEEMKKENKKLIADSRKLEGDRPASRIMRLERSESKMSNRAGSRTSMNDNTKH